MKVTYDQSVDAAYIYLILDNNIGESWVRKTYSCNPSEVNGMINLDFDSNDVLGGIEVLDASKKLPREVLENAMRIDI